MVFFSPPLGVLDEMLDELLDVFSSAVAHPHGSNLLVCVN